MAKVVKHSFPLAKPSRNRRIVAAVACLAAVAYLAACYPYYDSYENPLGAVLPHPPTERAQALDALAVLERIGAPVITNDVYALPFYPKLHASHISNEDGLLETCGDVPTMARRLAGAGVFAYRTDFDRVFYCTALDATLKQRFKQVYENDLYRVYDLRQEA